jgi:hypothetical protein
MAKIDLIQTCQFLVNHHLHYQPLIGAKIEIYPMVSPSKSKISTSKLDMRAKARMAEDYVWRHRPQQQIHHQIKLFAGVLRKQNQ